MFVNLKILYRMGSPLVFAYMLMLFRIFIWMLLLPSPQSRQNEDASYTGEFGKWAVSVAEDYRQERPVVCIMQINAALQSQILCSPLPQISQIMLIE